MSPRTKRLRLCWLILLALLAGLLALPGFSAAPKPVPIPTPARKPLAPGYPWRSISYDSAEKVRRDWKDHLPGMWDYKIRFMVPPDPRYKQSMRIRIEVDPTTRAAAETLKKAITGRIEDVDGYLDYSLSVGCQARLAGGYFGEEGAKAFARELRLSYCRYPLSPELRRELERRRR
jgi:hypothetical protein